MMTSVLSTSLAWMSLSFIKFETSTENVAVIKMQAEWKLEEAPGQALIFMKAAYSFDARLSELYFVLVPHMNHW